MFPVWTLGLYCLLALSGFTTREIHRPRQQIQQVLVKLVAGLKSGRSDPAESISPSERLKSKSVDTGTQTDFIAVHRQTPVVNFLESFECILEPSDIL